MLIYQMNEEGCQKLVGTNVWDCHFCFLSWSPLVWTSIFLHTCTEHSSFHHSPSSFFPSNSSGKEVHLQGHMSGRSFMTKLSPHEVVGHDLNSRPKFPPLLTFIGFHLIFHPYLPMDWDTLSPPPHPQWKVSTRSPDTSVSDHHCTFLPYVCGLSFLLTSVIVSLPSEP